MTTNDKWSPEETIRKVDAYADERYVDDDGSKEHELAIDSYHKVFYRIDEWSGWRFYWKAIKHRDWRSIKGHILTSYGLR